MSLRASQMKTLNIIFSQFIEQSDSHLYKFFYFVYNFFFYTNLPAKCLDFCKKKIVMYATRVSSGRV